MEKSVKLCTDVVESMLNLTVNANDIVTPANTTVKPEECSPRGVRTIIHTVGNQTNRVNISDSNTISYARIDESNDIQTIGEIDDIVAYEVIGNTIVFATVSGLKCVRWSGNRYLITDSRPQPLTIEFGAQKVGHLISNEKIEVNAETATMLGVGNPGMGASGVHTIIGQQLSARSDLSSTIINCYEKAMAEQVASKGYFTGPIFVRYAMRLANGRHIMPSSPILLLPNVLPPRIGITPTVIDDDKALIDTDLSENPFFEIRYRIATDIDSDWRDLICSVDIFASKPITTYQSGHPNTGHLTTLSQLIAGTDIATVRGRRQGSTATDIFIGHYSESADMFTDHYLSPANQQNVWYMQPNTHLQDDIIATDEYYMIASIPYSEAMAMQQFDALCLMFTDMYALKAKAILKEDFLSNADIIVESMLRHNGQLLLASSMKRLSCDIFYKSLNIHDRPGPKSDVEITTYIKDNGQDCIVRCTDTAPTNALSDFFPRLIYFPHSGAYKMRLRQGANVYTINLTPCPSGDGSYWWGGLSTHYIPVAESSIDIEDVRDIVTTDAKIYSTDAEEVIIFNKDIHCLDCRKILALVPANKTPAGGSFGQYMLYALTTDGIFMLNLNKTTDAYQSAIRISTNACSYGRNIIYTDNGIICATDQGLIMIKGSSVSNISDSLSYKCKSIYNLRHVDKLLDRYGIKERSVSFSKLLENSTLKYDNAFHAIILHNDDLEYTLYHNLNTGAWSSIDIRPSTGAKAGILVTKPIALRQSCQPFAIRTVEIIGEYAKGHVKAAVYGSLRLNDWHLLASSQSGTIWVEDVRHYRYIKVVIATNLDEDEYLESLQVAN